MKPVWPLLKGGVFFFFSCDRLPAVSDELSIQQGARVVIHKKKGKKKIICGKSQGWRWALRRCLFWAVVQSFMTEFLLLLFLEDVEKKRWWIFFFFFLSIKTSAPHPRDNLNFLFVWLYFQTLEEPHGLVLHQEFGCRQKSQILWSRKYIRFISV